MNEIKIKVKFKKGLCYSQGIKLVQNDYNSTKLVFEFDDNEGTKIFELRDSDDNVILADEIVNNELILARFDEHDNAYPIFTKEGEYVYEVSLYKDNSKLTSASDKFKVNAEQVIIDGEIIETYTPMFDNLLSDLSSALQETDNIDIDVNKVGNTATVSITKKDGTEKGVEIYDGLKGDNGADAKINWVNTLTIEAGTNITLDQEGKTLTINSTGGGGGGTSDYADLTNKPKINNVELVGNKSLNDLGIQPAGNYALESEIPDVSNFVTNTVDNLVNYYKKSETFTKQEVNNLISAITTMDIQVVQTLPVQDISTTTIYLVPKTTAEQNDAYDEYIYVSNNWEHIGSTDIDLSGYQTKIDSTHKLSSDLVDDTNNNNKFVTSSEKTTWSAKYTKPSGGIPATDLTTSVQNTLTKADNQVWYGTQAQYDALSQINPNTLYCIVED